MLCKKRSAFRHGHSVSHATHASPHHCSLVSLVRGQIPDDKYRHVRAGLTHGLAEAEKSHEALAALRGPGGAVVHLGSTSEGQRTRSADVGSRDVQG